MGPVAPWTLGGALDKAIQDGHCAEPGCGAGARCNIRLTDYNASMANFCPLAIIATYNDIDIAPQVVSKLLDEGVDVYLLDNWSSDGTFDALSELGGGRFRQGRLSIERFPAEGPTRYFDLRAILRRKEEIALRFPGRWIIHQDSDEVRRSPWPKVGFREGLRLVNEAGFTAVDFVVLAFRPIDDSYKVGVDPEAHFRYFEWGDPNFSQIKVWKQPRERIDLANTAGHAACFQGRTVFPEKFHLKHYSLRHPEQAKRKIFAERLGRLQPDALAAGWHVHYHRRAANGLFVWDPATLVDYLTIHQ